MKLLTSKNFTQKIIIALVFVILFNFVSPQISFGGVGGVLFEPIQDLTLTIADGLMWVMQKIIFGIDTSLMKLEYDASWVASFTGWAVGLGVAVAFIAAPFTLGTSLTIGAAIIGGYAAYKAVENSLPQSYYLPLYAISPAEIFKNQIALLDVNFFNPNSYDQYKSATGEEGTKEQVSSAAILQPMISQWYFTIRNFALVALLSVLVYIGIRLVISSAAQDKAKYKQRLMDWVIAMCLLFFLHYIMTFAVTVTELITQSLNSVNKPFAQYIGSDDGKLKDYHWDVQVTDKNTGEKQTISGKVFDTGTETFQNLQSAGVIKNGRPTQGSSQLSGGGYSLIWPMNLMAKARHEAQLEIDGEDGDNTLVRKFGFTIIFVGLIIYTVLFLFRYLKRLLMLAFLTMIAPLVAMTYPLDKMNDGNAQAFNTWLKEYIYNLLIQPVHLILYTALMGTAIDFVSENLIYALAAFGFMLQAEKIMRKFFGFEKASTLATGSALGGALAMQGISMLSKIGKSKPKAANNANATTGANRVRNANNGRSTDDLLSNMNNGTESTAPATAHEENASTDTDSITMATPSPMLETESSAAPITNNVPDEQGSDATTNVQRAQNNTNQAELAGDTVLSSNMMRNNDAASRATPRTRRQKIKGALKGAGAVAGSGIKYIAPRAGTALAKAAVRTAITAPITGTATISGIAAGLVSDDYSNVAKWGAAGGAAGMVVGSAVNDMMAATGQHIHNIKNPIRSTFEQAAYGKKEAEARQIAREDKAAMKDPSRRELYKDKLDITDNKELQTVMEQAQKYRESGITDDDMIINAMKLGGLGERDSDQRILSAALAKEVKEESGTRREKLQVAEDKMQDHNFSEEDIRKYIDHIKRINKWKK